MLCPCGKIKYILFQGIIKRCTYGTKGKESTLYTENVSEALFFRREENMRMELNER